MSISKLLLVVQSKKQFNSCVSEWMVHPSLIEENTIKKERFCKSINSCSVMSEKKSDLINAEFFCQIKIAMDFS